MCGNERCQLDIVTLSDKKSKNKNKKQVYLSGALHGDEIIGPNAVYYFIEYMLNNNLSTTKHILENVEIILTPMTNAVGYYYREREERTSADVQNRIQVSSFDINRDFPYNQKSPKDCLNTIAGRVVYSIMTRNYLQATLTFHGGTNVLGYPWGSYNRSHYDKASPTGYDGDLSPDNTIFNSFGKVMRESAGAVSYDTATLGSPTLKNEYVPKYVLGNMSYTVYPVGGGMEDWGYGGGWDNKDKQATVAKCTPRTTPLSPQIRMSLNDQKRVRSLIYLVETADKKSPPAWTLGGRLEDGNTISGIYSEERTKNGDIINGHINRNIRLMYSMLEMVDPWIEILGYQQKEVNETQTIDLLWKINGCTTQIDLA